MDEAPDDNSPRIFENPLLEKLSRAHPRLPIIMYGPVAAVALRFALRDLAAPTALGFVLVGYFLWTLLEYFGHRFIFHLELPGALGARVHFLLHGVHHEYPNDPWRLVMPPLMSLPVLGGAVTILYWLFGAALVAPVLCGFLVGYILYDTLHYETHHGAMRSRLGRRLKQRHMLHHFRDPTRGFGISCPWLDAVLGTAFAAIARRR